MSLIQAHLTRPWQIKLPMVIRYLEKMHVQAFFETGELQLTTFAQCKKHDDNARHDANEGQSNFHLVLGDTAIAGFYSSGSSSYVLCGSMVESKTTMQQFSRCDDYFRIIDTVNFASAVATQMAGFVTGLQGACIYRSEKSLDRRLSAAKLPDPQRMIEAAQSNNPGLTEHAFHELRNQHGQLITSELAMEPYFVKALGYAQQAEYRLIWTVDKPVKTPLKIFCPDARRFCDFPGRGPFPEIKRLDDMSGAMVMGRTLDPETGER